MMKTNSNLARAIEICQANMDNPALCLELIQKELEVKKGNAFVYRTKAFQQIKGKTRKPVTVVEKDVEEEHISAEDRKLAVANMIEKHRKNTVNPFMVTSSSSQYTGRYAGR